MSVPLFPPGVRLRSIALPMEHGGWGFLLEPIVLGLALAPAPRGWALAIAAIAAFLLRQPLKVWWSGVRAGHASPRTRPALVIAGAYAFIAAGCGCLAFAGTLRAALPLAFASPMVLAIVWYDARNRSRDLVPEILGPVALAATGASIVMLDGWDLPVASAVWALLVLRAVPSVLYVRSRLRLGYGRPTNLAVPIGAHVAALALVFLLAGTALAPRATVPLYGLLLLRAGAGLSPLRRPLSAKAVGFSEIGWGVITVLWVALAFHFA